jgi:ATP-dependent Lon protease
MKYRHNDEDIVINTTLPVVPLRDVVVFPYMVYPLLIGRDFTTKALQKAMDSDKQILLLTQRLPGTDNPTPDDLFKTGVVARILQVVKMPNGTFKVLIEGIIRARVTGVGFAFGHLQARIEPIVPDEAEDRETEAMARSVSELFAEYVQLNRRIPDEVLVPLASLERHQQLADTIAAQLLHKIDKKQQLLEATTTQESFELLVDLLREEIEILKIEQRIDGTVRESMSRGQREFYLQQQLKAIKDELGQYDETSAEADDLYAKLESGDYPQAVKEKAEEEVRRFAKMHPYSAEAAVIRAYLDWLLDMPWNERTEGRKDFGEVKAILDADHYGLEKAKRRIIEHLAVIRLAGRLKGPILCFVGPPGVGKTSVGRSIGRALGCNFVRMSLGGIHDEAEIRGHRRTYIGAMPGRIVQCVKKAGSANPVFLLDEVDKIGKDFRGDPAAALLEVLDPEQNHTFTDNYLEVEFDLSNVLFLTTANTVDSIPPALVDRMEIIRLPGYLDFEKKAIARDYLLPKLKTELGLEHLSVEFKDDALQAIISQYTREAGVRELERQMNAVLRKYAVQLAEGKRLRKLTITRAKAQKALGVRKYTGTNIRPQPTIGYAVGMAWTSAGGDLLPVEVAPMQGKAKLTLTGSLGDVMQESATAALSYIRQHGPAFGLDPGFFDNLDLHVHIPEGAVPKDGPSAGVTMVTAMLSSLTEIPVRTDTALTGEITLTGDILPVGGLGEKLLAAKRMGITRIVLPHRNKKDLADLKKDLLEGLNLRYARTIRDVLNLAMVKSPFRTSRAKPSSRSGVGIQR